MIKIQQASSELEYAARKKLIKESYIKDVILNKKDYTEKELNVIIKKTNEMLQFYNRIITSMTKNLEKVLKHKSSLIDENSKKQENKNGMLKELSQAKKERVRFRKYIKELKSNK